MMMLLDLSLTESLVHSAAAQRTTLSIQYSLQQGKQTCGKGTHRKASKHANAFGHVNEGQLLRCGHNDSR